LPVLSAMPLAGSLFASSRRQQRQTELLVLITPHRFDAGAGGAGVAVRDQPEMVDRAGVLKDSGGTP
jgi:Flp pilus assembly secretin CpaC